MLQSLQRIYLGENTRLIRSETDFLKVIASHNPRIATYTGVATTGVVRYTVNAAICDSSVFKEYRLAFGNWLRNPEIKLKLLI